MLYNVQTDGRKSFSYRSAPSARQLHSIIRRLSRMRSTERKIFHPPNNYQLPQTPLQRSLTAQVPAEQITPSILRHIDGVYDVPLCTDCTNRIARSAARFCAVLQSFSFSIDICKSIVYTMLVNKNRCCR